MEVVALLDIGGVGGDDHGGSFVAENGGCGRGDDVEVVDAAFLVGDVLDGAGKRGIWG